MVLTTTLFSWLFVKSFLHLPDGYSREFERDPRPYAAPVDYHKRISIDVPVGTFVGRPTVTLRFDGEDRALGAGAAALRLRLQWNF
jgi:hypothetical protein